MWGGHYYYFAHTYLTGLLTQSIYLLTKIFTQMRTSFVIYFNGKPIKRGKAEFKSEQAEHSFEEKMQKKYSRNENDCVMVLYI